MRNDGVAVRDAEFPKTDIEKQGSEAAEDGACGGPENAAVGEPEDSAEKIIDVVVVDCGGGVGKGGGEPQIERDSTSGEECRYILILVGCNSVYPIWALLAGLSWKVLGTVFGEC